MHKKREKEPCQIEKHPAKNGVEDITYDKVAVIAMIFMKVVSDMGMTGLIT